MTHNVRRFIAIFLLVPLIRAGFAFAQTNNKADEHDVNVTTFTPSTDKAQLEGQNYSVEPVSILNTLQGDETLTASKHVVVRDSYGVQTDANYKPPIVIIYDVMTSSNNLCISYAADQIIFNWAKNPDELYISGGPANGINQLGAGKLPLRRYVQIMQIVLPDEMKIYINGKLRYAVAADFTTVNMPIRIFTQSGGTVTIRDLRVANIPQPQLPEISATGNIPIATTMPGETQISQNKDPDTISAPEKPNRPKPFAKVQSEVQGLAVSRLDNGDMAGQTLDIIATVSPSGNPNDPAAFVDSAIGPDMRTSLQEAIRAIQVRYPTWGNGTIQISFGDEYSQKDGGSAGAAFALLFLSELENFDIDNQFSITGEITTDWKLRSVGGVAAKIQGAVDNGCKAVILPETNLQQVQDAMLLNGQDTAWKIQIFTEPDLQHAEALIRSDRAKNLQQAIDLFFKVQDEFRNKGDPALYDPQIIGELKQVLVLAPEMESAQYLLEESQGKEPRKLSDFASEYEAIVHIYPIQDLIFSDKNVVINRTTLPSLVVDKMRRNLGQLRDISPDNTVPLINSLIDLVNICDQFADNRVSSKAVSDQAGLVAGELQALSMDHDMVQKMAEQGI